MKEFMLQSFNREECRLDAPSSSPLASIEYRPAKVIPTYLEDIAEDCQTLPWERVYGLDFEQVMNLPFNEYQELKGKLLTYLENAPPPPEVMQTDLLRQLIAKMDEAAIHQLAFMKALSGKTNGKQGFEKREHAETAVKRPPLPTVDQ